MRGSSQRRLRSTTLWRRQQDGLLQEHARPYSSGDLMHLRSFLFPAEAARLVCEAILDFGLSTRACAERSSPQARVALSEQARRSKAVAVLRFSRHAVQGDRGTVGSAGLGSTRVLSDGPFPPLQIRLVHCRSLPLLVPAPQESPSRLRWSRPIW